MTDQMQDSIIFSLHIILLTAKIIAVFVIARMFIFTRSMDKNSFVIMANFWQLAILIFTASVMSAEIWILSNYYFIASNFYYELLSMIDQLALTALLISSYKGGKNNGS